MFTSRPVSGAPRSDRAWASLGAAVGIAVTGLVVPVIQGGSDVLLTPWIVPPIGASAVLVFAVPASPMAQPWAVIGGDTLSTAVGLVVGALLGHGAIACGIAVGLAIALMSVCRCLHPPGGAAALLAALAVGTGISFAAAPVAADAAVLVCASWVYHRCSPQLAAPAGSHHVGAAVSNSRRGERATPVSLQPHITDADLQAVVNETHEVYAIDADDLRDLLERLEARIGAR